MSGKLRARGYRQALNPIRSRGADAQRSLWIVQAEQVVIQSGRRMDYRLFGYARPGDRFSWVNEYLPTREEAERRRAELEATPPSFRPTVDWPPKP